VPLYLSRFGATRLPEFGPLFDKLDGMLSSLLLAILAGSIVDGLDGGSGPRLLNQAVIVNGSAFFRLTRPHVAPYRPGNACVKVIT